jgi:hypothetical protein
MNTFGFCLTTSLNMGRGWVCFPHEPKAILNFEIDSLVNFAVNTDKKRKRKNWARMFLN